MRRSGVSDCLHRRPGTAWRALWLTPLLPFNTGCRYPRGTAGDRLVCRPGWVGKWRLCFLYPVHKIVPKSKKKADVKKINYSLLSEWGDTICA